MDLNTVNQDFKSYFNDVKQNTLAVIVKLKDFRNDPEFFLKICQVAAAALHLIIARYTTAVPLVKLQATLETASMHDFYRFLQQPRRWFCPVDAMTIDENAVLDSLEEALCQVFNVGGFPSVTPTGDGDETVDSIEEETEQLPTCEGNPEVRLIAKAYLQKQLEDMNTFGDAYASVEEFKEALQKRFEATGKDKKGNPLTEKDANGNPIKDVHGNPVLVQGTHLGKICIVNGEVKLYCPEDDEEGDIETFDMGNISLEDIENIEVPLRHVPLGERFTNFLWGLVDIGCVDLYFQAWKLVDTAEQAERIGTKYPAFQWVKSQSLELWVRGLVCGAYAVKLFEACRKLRDEQLTDEQRRHAKWHSVTAVAELISNGAGFLDRSGLKSINPTYLQWLTIVAKTVGLLEIATKPRHKFFEIAAPAA